LEERNFFEDSFKVYENALTLFGFPHVKGIWHAYLDRFVARYEGTKLERLRDLFEQVVSTAPEENAAEFFIKYAKAEEKYGLIRHAVSVYDRATKAVPEASRLDMYRIYIKKVEQHYGLTKTRPIYEKAISVLSDDMTRQICLDFAEMERKLGEVDRARSILAHGSQFADPHKDQLYWKVWRDFEEAHGNEDTFRDMLRIQRSVDMAISAVKNERVLSIHKNKI
jgi:pre-mRNA-splicing factor SYF1